MLDMVAIVLICSLQKAPPLSVVVPFLKKNTLSMQFRPAVSFLALLP